MREDLSEHLTQSKWKPTILTKTAMTPVDDGTTWGVLALPIVHWPRPSINSPKTADCYPITINQAYWSLQEQGQLAFHMYGHHAVTEDSEHRIGIPTEPDNRVIDADSLPLPLPT